MKSLLITGGTGSLGRAMVSEALYAPFDVVTGTRKPAWDRIVVLSRHEFLQWMMRDQFKADARLRYFIGDVRDRARLERAFYGVETVIHTAALKYVGEGVYNVDEIVKTNIMGTLNVVEAAATAGVKRVLVITSDKGCHPVNAYGASKQMAEHLAVDANAFTFPRGTRVSCVRFGNLLWSRGSVMHRFREQFSAKQPMTITHPGMTRFGITMSEAVGFIEAALDRMRGGEIFVPQLPSLRIWDCALAVGNEEPRVVGVRLEGGEKLHEMMLTEEESVLTREITDQHGTCWVVEPASRSWDRPDWKGTPVPEGFTVTSDKNSRWLSVSDLRGTWKELDPGLPAA